MSLSSDFGDARVKRLGARLHKIYAQASEELTGKVNSFFEDFKRLDEKKQALVAAGQLAEKEYKEWRKNKILMGDKYKDLRDTMAQRMTEANQIASRYINHELPSVYAHNYNDLMGDVSEQVKGFSFDLVNERTVRKLSTSDKTLLPYKFVDGRRDVRWNSQRVNAQVLQGVLQGESATQIANRLLGVTAMNESSALRNARTAVTSAQNKGRFDAMRQCEDDGVIMYKEWIATNDERTREAHEELDRVQVPYDEPFENEIGQIMYPGDPDADPANTYNCRCTIAEVVKGFKKKEDAKEEEAEEQETEPLEHEKIDQIAEPKTAEEMQTELEEESEFEPLNKELDDVWTPNGDYEAAENKREFMKENMRELKENGVRSVAGANEQFENTMMHEASENVHLVSDQEAVDTVRDNVPDSWMRGWFVDADSEYKPKLEDAILGNPEVLNAGWNIAYRDFIETVGADSGKTFEDFLYTPMSMFRGTNGQSEIASDVWSSFSMDRKIAESFGKAIEEIVIRPIDTWGAYQTTAEAEILVPARMLKKLRGV